MMDKAQNPSDRSHGNQSEAQYIYVRWCYLQLALQFKQPYRDVMPYGKTSTWGQCPEIPVRVEIRKPLAQCLNVVFDKDQRK
jgi:hypothetical protein